MRVPRRVWETVGHLYNGWGRTSDAELRKVVRGQVVLITGASFGIGAATARRVAAAGAKVLLVGRTAERLDRIAGEIIAAGGAAWACPADLTDGAEVDALVKQVLDEHGQVDILINNAGKSIRRSLALSYDRPQDFERTIAVNYLGAVRLTLGLLSSMRERRSGHVINVSTVGVHGLPPAPRWAAYQSSKAALDVWMRSMAAEVRGDRISVSNVYMGLVHTRMSAPTYRRTPGLTPDGAAGLLADVIVHRPRSFAPWWAPVAGVVTALLPRPAVEMLLSAMYERTADTPSARGERAAR
jgi:NAD(P)-dependent dehydrogenase (short-subunit alcohol dehydrogenase family)